MAKTPDQRPTNAQTVVKELDAISQSLASGNKDSSTTPNTAPVTPAQPQVVYVPMAISMLQSNPFAGITEADEEESSEQEMTSQEESKAKPKTKTQTGSKTPLLSYLPILIGVAFLGFVTVIGAGVIIIKITNKDGSVTEIKVPDDSKVEVIKPDGAKPKDKSTPPNATPLSPSTIAADPDRRAADWVVKVGGQVAFDPAGVVLGQTIPGGQVRLTAVKLSGLPKLQDSEFNVFQGCKHLQVIYLDSLPIGDEALLSFQNSFDKIRWVSMNKVTISDRGMRHLRQFKALENLDITGTPLTALHTAHLENHVQLRSLGLAECGLTDESLMVFRNYKNLESLNLGSNSEVTDAGLAHFNNAKRLRTLILDFTKVGDGVRHFIPLPHLEGLHVYSTRVNDTTFEGLSFGHYFKSLSMGYPQRPEVGDGALKACARCRLEHLSLFGTKVTAAGLAAIEDPGRITKLHSGYNMLGEEVIPFLKRCYSLNDLSLDGTRFTKEKLQEIATALPLCRISIGNDKFIEPTFTQEDRAAAEHVLKLGGTAEIYWKWKWDHQIKDIADLPKEPFALVGFNLKGKANTTNADLVRFKDCKELRSINLEGTGISDDGLESLKGCKHLRVLALNGSKVAGKGLVHLQNCRRLSSLGLDFCAVTDSDLEVAKSWPDLAYLPLIATQVTDKGLVHLKGCRDLLGLWLSGTKVTDAGLEQLRDHPSLDGLILRQTVITDEGLAKLAGCQRLRSLELQNTKVTENGVRQLAAKLTKCKIEWDGGVIEPKAAFDPDRNAAEYVLSLGGSVCV